MEDIFADIGKRERFAYMLKALIVPRSILQKLYFHPVSHDDTAAILFSSGSEGEPKGVELTHRNLLGNIKQVSAMLDFRDDDLILNSLPIFHSFGLTVTMLLPLCEGIPTATVADPTDAASIGRMSARYAATILFGTSTFFGIYARSRKIPPPAFADIRMAVAGAEKLKPHIARSFKQKFGIDIYEGYGATETSPVVSVNMPDAVDRDTFRLVIGSKPGSVGQALPGTKILIVDPETMEELPAGSDGLICIGGVQVMKGYFADQKKSAEVLYERDEIRYYKSGDKGHLDEDGFIYITDRYSRFAKIGGEMVSLGAVEEAFSILAEAGAEYMAVALADEKKGERIVLLYSGIDDARMRSLAADIKIAPIMKPSDFVRVDAVPRLASGKSDFKKGAQIAAELSGRER